MADTRRPLSFFTDFLLGLHPRTHQLCRIDAERGTFMVGGARNQCMRPLPTSAVLGQSKDFRSIPQRFASFYFACSTDAPSIPASCADIALGTFGILSRSTLVRRFGRLNLDR